MQHEAPDTVRMIRGDIITSFEIGFDFKRKDLHYTTSIKSFPLLPHASVSDTD